MRRSLFGAAEMPFESMLLRSQIREAIRSGKTLEAVEYLNKIDKQVRPLAEEEQRVCVSRGPFLAMRSCVCEFSRARGRSDSRDRRKNEVLAASAESCPADRTGICFFLLGVEA